MVVLPLLSFAADTTIPGYRQVFSSYPGVIMSGDDFYMISSGLVSELCALCVNDFYFLFVACVRPELLFQ